MITGTEKILAIEALRIGYKRGGKEKVILPELCSTAFKGELIAVIGKNGVGKSTLLRTITGIQSALGGKIYHEGKDILDYTRMELARKVGYISTEIVRATNMNVYDLVALGRFPYTNWAGKIDEKNNQIIVSAIENAGMTALSARYLGELSDGERQRAMIARILAQDTGLMIMDEPTAFLDIGSKYEILHLLHNLAKERGKTIIFSTHDLHIAVSQADKIWLLTETKLVEGAPEDLMIGGEFDHIFDSSPVRYNSDHGTFTFPSDDKGSIYLEGDGILRHWTEKAINRAGYSVAGNKTNPFIIIPSGNCKNWCLITDKSITEFDSIYELISGLDRKPLESI